MLRNVLAAALLYVASGLSVLPIRADGSKRPALDEWGMLQTRQPTQAEIHLWFDTKRKLGIAMICGRVSGNVEVIDFDDYDTFITWLDLLEEQAPGLFERLMVVETPRGGRHIIYRCSHIQGSKKLALRLVEVAEGTPGAKLRGGRWTQIKTLAETKGEGGYVIVAPSPGAVHPTGKPYRVLAGDYCQIPEINLDSRLLMLALAASLNEYHEPEYKPPSGSAPRDPSILRPGDDFNSRGDWHTLLTTHGWRCVKQYGATSYWRGPHDNEGHHATVNYKGSNLLYVFSTCTEFQTERGYSLFSAYTLLEHNGDCHAAAQALAAQGYGEQKPKKRNKKARTLCVEPLQRPSSTVKIETVSRPTNTMRLEKPTRPLLTIKMEVAL